ncbi:hypothetical protein ACVW0K_007347, partial [Streptomyces filamentosus]
MGGYLISPSQSELDRASLYIARLVNDAGEGAHSVVISVEGIGGRV